MSKESYIKGFSKTAEAHGFNPEKLASYALKRKLQKQAFIGAVKGLATAGKYAKKVLPTIGRGIKAIGREGINNLKNPEARMALGAAGLGYGITGYMRDRHVINSKLRQLFTPKSLQAPASSIQPQIPTNAVPLTTQTPTSLQ